MLAISKPIGRFVAIANLQKNILPQKSIEKEITKLVNLITLQIKSKSVEEVAESLLENIFELRMNLMDWLIKNKSDFLNIIDKYVAVNIQLAPYSDLAHTISKVFLAYRNIISPILESFDNSTQSQINTFESTQIRYDMFKELALHPNPKIAYLKKWLDASLEFELSVILGDLILTEQVRLSEKRIKSELIELLYESITRFGAYSIFTEAWKPSPDDNSNLTNRMKILASTTELDNGFGFSIPVNQLIQSFSN